MHNIQLEGRARELDWLDDDAVRLIDKGTIGAS
jgi:hypothetical protein